MKRSSFVALAVAAIAAAAPTAALAGPPKRLTPRVVATGAAVLGTADASTIALQTNAGSVLVRNDAGAHASVAAPAGCTLGAVGGGVIAWDCGDTKMEAADGVVVRPFVRHMVVTDLVGAVVGTTDVQHSGELSKTVAVGGQWVEHWERDSNGKGGYNLHTNWHTGERRWLSNSAAGVQLDLDRADLVTPYCAPIRAQEIEGWVGHRRSVQYRAPWAIVETRTGSHPHNLFHHELRRCGLARLVTAPASLTTGIDVVLGAGWVAWRPRSTTSTLHLLRLSDRRRYVVAAARLLSSSFPFPERPAISFTTGRLWLVDGTTTVRSVALPRR